MKTFLASSTIAKDQDFGKEIVTNLTALGVNFSPSNQPFQHPPDLSKHF